jgi:hypothetical protein
MHTDLFKLPNRTWAVKSDKATDTHPQDTGIVTCITIEAAAEYMESLGVRSDEIDAAIMTMAGLLHTRARFDFEGYFQFSDEAKPSELFGAA